MLYFEWDADKAAANAAKHGVFIDDAATVFGDPLSLTRSDPAHSSAGEERFVTIGLSASGTLIVVVQAGFDDRIRLISARRATRTERKAYKQEP